jgi:hypothetical protein
VNEFRADLRHLSDVPLGEPARHLRAGRPGDDREACQVVEQRAAQRRCPVDERVLVAAAVAAEQEAVGARVSVNDRDRQLVVVDVADDLRPDAPRRRARWG